MHITNIRLSLREYLVFTHILILLSFTLTSCKNTPSKSTPKVTQTSLEKYVSTPDPAFDFEVVHTIEEDDYDAVVIKMTSQNWLTTAEVEDPLWWHWVTIVIPKDVQSNTGLLWIGGGSRNNEMPTKAPELILQTALHTNSIAAEIHNIPNQPMVFKNDDYGPRVEDELIAFGWRKYLEGGGVVEDDIWLARLPMTKAVVRAMDVISEYTEMSAPVKVDSFTIAGGSKRGWTTWTTAIVDDRVVAIVPIVIDMLNIVPSFQHHWQAYGFWAPAVGNYEGEGIMNWQGRPEYEKLMKITEPYTYRDRLTLPKLLINATGDQFFLPDSWQYYWSDLKGEKHLRYVANGDHSLSGTDAIESLIAFHKTIVNHEERPDFNWHVDKGHIKIQTNTGMQPDSILFWHATNPTARDFRVETIGEVWQNEPIPLSDKGQYDLYIAEPEQGWSAYYGELIYTNQDGPPIKFTTGVFVSPDTLPYPPFRADIGR